MNTVLLSALAILLDLAIGDPRWLPHPVIVMGKWIGMVDKRLNHPSIHSPGKQRFYGFLLTLSTLLLFAGATFVLVFVLHKFVPWLSWLVSILLIATTIAWKGLVQAGRDVYNALQKEGLVAGRREVGKIVGRDTDELSESEVTRATVETLAENIVDAIVSPVFYACIGGAPLAILYRVTNTLDSMVGYKNDRYRYFGTVSARLDDVLNYIPARLTACILQAVIWLSGANARRAWQTMRRDARRHPSPNSGIPESLVAGALGVQLGGLNRYGGVASERARMGTPDRPLVMADIFSTIRFVNWTACGIFVLAVVGGGFWWLCTAGLF